MAFKFHLPDIGEGVVEGEIVGWKVKVGDKVALDQPIVEIMTDKATVEIPSPRAGTIAKINFAEGEKCPVGQVLVEIEEDGKAVAAPTPSGNGHGAPAKAPTPPPRAIKCSRRPRRADSRASSGSRSGESPAPAATAASRAKTSSATSRSARPSTYPRRSRR